MRHLDARRTGRMTRAGAVPPSSTPLAGTNLAAEAAGVLRLYWTLSTLGVVGTVGVGALMYRSVDPFEKADLTALSLAASMLAMVGAVAACRVLNQRLGRVIAAGGQVARDGRAGGWVLVAIFVLVVTSGWALTAVAAAREPAIEVSASISCSHGRTDRCNASWRHDGRIYGSRVPSDLETGESRIQIRISAARPDVSLSGLDTPLRRYAVWPAVVVVVAGAARWLLRSIALTRTLRGLAGAGADRPRRRGGS